MWEVLLREVWYECVGICFFFFFFKQKTAYEILTCDWSSDVCSSDLGLGTEGSNGSIFRNGWFQCFSV